MREHPVQVHVRNVRRQGKGDARVVRRTEGPHHLRVINGIKTELDERNDFVNNAVSTIETCIDHRRAIMNVFGEALDKVRGDDDDLIKPLARTLRDRFEESNPMPYASRAACPPGAPLAGPARTCGPWATYGRSLRSPPHLPCPRALPGPASTARAPRRPCGEFPLLSLPELTRGRAIVRIAAHGIRDRHPQSETRLD